MPVLPSSAFSNTLGTNLSRALCRSIAIAFALATPYAQEHNMPWLYAVAASTALGRVQQREHWLSDTVAGAMLGYAIGSLLTDQQHERSSVRLSLTPTTITAQWSFK